MPDINHEAKTPQLHFDVDGGGRLHVHEAHGDGSVRCLGTLDNLHARALIGMLEAGREAMDG